MSIQRSLVSKPIIASLLVSAFLGSMPSWAETAGTQASKPATPKSAFSKVVGSNSKVEARDYYDLGVKWGLGIDHIAQANPHRAQNGQLLLPLSRILPTDAPQDGLIVNVAERLVYVFKGGKFDHFYPVAIGLGGRFATPTGPCKIIEKVKNPTWTPPEWAGMGEGTVVDAGPDNPLGERWIGLSLPGFGFHGTLSPTSVGSAASHGCMRMYSGSVRELFEKVQVGWPVRLEYETARLGTTADGTICAVVFPDVYSQKPSDTQLRRQLASSGLEEWVDEAVVNRLVSKPRGVVEPIVEGGVQLVFANKLVAPTAGRPYLLKTKQGLMISTEALAKLGCQVEYDQASRLITAQRVVEVKATAPKAPPVPETPVQDPVTPVNSTVPGVETTPIPATPGAEVTPEPVPQPVPMPTQQTLRLQGSFQAGALGSYAGESLTRAYSVNGQSFMPARQALQYLEYGFQWEAKTKQLKVYSHP
jgi:L,D-transpeptidase ErfK/SrfK